MAEPPRITPPQPHPDDTLGIVGLVLSIIGIIVCCGCLSFLCPIGLILSIVSHNRRQTGITLAGIIVGAIGTLWFIGWVIYMIVVSANPDLYNEMMRRVMEEMGGNFPSL